MNIPIGILAQDEPSFYDDIVALGLGTNLKLCLDAGSASSYDGSSQSWLDLAGSGYDFFRGADGSAASDDPTFNGTSGNLTSGEYFSFDGGDYFNYDSAVETWMSNLHQNSAAFSWAFWFYSPASFTGSLCGTVNSSTGFHGINIMNNGTNTVAVTALNGSAHVMGGSVVVGDTALSTSAWNFVAGSIDEATGAGGGFHYLNGVRNQVSGVDTFDCTYTSPSSTAASSMCFGSPHGAADYLGNGSRLGGVMFWEGGVLTKANFDSIWNRQKGRYGL